MIARALLLAAALASVALSALAQEATLIADRLTINADNTLTASGNVEVFFEGTRLTASQVTYSAEGDRLEIAGPLRLTDAEGRATLIADSAALDSELKAGILRGARLVLANQLQLAATQIDVVGGRFTQLTRTVASSCQVCANSPTPLWEIRARNVIHDAEEQQLYFTGAQVRLGGVPILYVPRLRMPDPTLDRAAGFLAPDIQTSSRLGTGIRTPYFLPFGDHADLTVTPYLASSTATVESTFRWELPFGRLRFDSALTRDDIEPGDTRGYFFGDGLIYLPRQFELSFDIEVVSDNAYLFEYGYSDKDRLDSGVALARTRDRDDFRAEITSFRTLRGSEIATENDLPNEVIELSYTRRLGTLPGLGEVWGTVQSMSLERPSSAPTTGRDVARLGAAVEADNAWIIGPGVVAESRARFDIEQYVVNQDPAFAATVTQTTPSASFTLRWPLARTAADGAALLLEPSVQLAWSDPSGGPGPNEDSSVVEFDEGNLLSLSRYPGVDKVEDGLRADLALGWTRVDPDGWSLGLTAGRILRFSGTNDFGSGSGLAGDLSDWMVAATYTVDTRFALQARTVFDDGFSFSRGETRFAWSADSTDLAANYLWIAANPAEGRPEDTSELSIDTTYRFDDNWSASADWRYEADAGRTTAAGLGLLYQNECIGVDLSLSRRFTASATVEPLTDVALRVFLTGFGTGTPGRPDGTCGG
jgi:LPS-assembly protein